MKHWINLFAVTLFFVFLTPVAFAQQQAGAGLSPTLIEQGADPGETLVETLTVSNLSDEERTYFLFTRDISGVRDGGSPIFAREDTEKTGFEISEWVSLSQEEVTLAPNSDQQITLTIAVPENATPGSHFGGVFVSAEPPRLRQIGAGVGYEVANILSIRISGDALESAQIRTLSTDKLIYGSTEVEFTARVENKGNVLVRPVGPLEIYNMFGQQVTSITFNDSLGGVFPGTVRDFVVTWKDDGLGFGRYQGELSMVYGEEGVSRSTISAAVSFWVLPMEIIRPALIVLGILLLVSYVSVRLYIKRTVRQLSGGRKLVRRHVRQSSNSTLLLVAIVMFTVTAFFLLLLLVLFA